MAEFRPAMDKLAGLEGGYAEDDFGAGQVKYGLTERFLREHNYTHEADHLKDLQLEDAEQIYRHEWWDKYSCGELPNQELANTFFCAIVNQGPTWPTRALQAGINAQLRVTVRPKIREDGIVGPKTLRAARFCNPLWLRDQVKLGSALRYMRIADSGPAESGDYASVLSEWASRLEAS